MARFQSVAACVVLSAIGCEGGKPPEVAKSSYNPEGAAKEMLAEYDANKNGSIDGSELDACPSLKSALANFDTNKDKKVDQGELFARFKTYGAANFGTNGVSVRVVLNGNPIADATVTFTPEKCFADAVKGGKAITRGDGTAVPVRDDGAPGLSPGLYRVTLTGGGAPPEYATQNLLGYEVGVGGRDGGASELKLSSKSK